MLAEMNLFGGSVKQVSASSKCYEDEFCYAHDVIGFPKARFSYRRAESTLSLPISEADRDHLAKLWGDYKSSQVWDEGAIRLEAVSDDNTCVISEISFYDLLVTNIVRQDYVGFRNFLQACGDEEGLAALGKLRDIFIDIVPESFEDVLHSPLSNAVAVSILLYAPNNDLLLVRRSNDVAIGQGLLSVGVTGSMNKGDYSSPDPVVAATLRECREELGIELDPHKIYVHGLAAGKRKLQPAFTVSAVVDGSFGSLLAVRPECAEISKVLKLGNSILDLSAVGAGLTEIAKHQLSSDSRIVR